MNARQAAAELKVLHADIAKLDRRKISGDGMDFWVDVFRIHHTKKMAALLKRFPSLKRRTPIAMLPSNDSTENSNG